MIIWCKNQVIKKPGEGNISPGLFPDILMHKTDKLVYIPKGDKQNNSYCNLQ